MEHLCAKGAYIAERRRGGKRMRIASPLPICCVRREHKACSISYASEARAQAHLLLVVLLTFLNMKQDLSLTCEFWYSMGDSGEIGLFNGRMLSPTVVDE